MSYRCIPKDGALCIVVDGDQDYGRNQGAAKTDNTVDPDALPKDGRVSIVEKDEEDVERHGERPPRIRLHEPICDEARYSSGPYTSG